MKPILEVQHITKQFKIGAKQEGYLSLRDALSNPFRKKPETENTFLALDNVSFNVYPGESIGIIGRNGAGKSTLLKILSKITPPTSGKIISRGRVASLLEVGTGFHPELSGRENIYMNGSILGMKKHEINKHFDEIVDFSGVEKFLDTPLKRYSSGMQLRLAFAVAAYLEPEILIIDEVLAVGDAEFQKKCLGKMDEVSKSGRTVLFVSHNLGAVQQLCSNAILLNKGSLIAANKTPLIIEEYLNVSQKENGDFYSYGSKKVEIINFELLNHLKKISHDLFLGYPCSIFLKIKFRSNVSGLEIGVNIKDIYGDLLSHITSIDQNVVINGENGDEAEVEIKLNSVNFTPGAYKIDLFLLKNEMFHANLECLNFTVLDSDKTRRPSGFPTHVKFFTDCNWEIKNLVT
ncbi:MAG: ABC transporter ATP-binding protein [Ginsengibacter sp.]